MRARIRILERGDAGARVTLEARDEAGRLVVRVGELALRRAASGRRGALYRVAWEPVAASGPARRAAVLGEPAGLP